MATVKIQKNILDDKVDIFSVDEGISIESLIRQNTEGDAYESTLVECYDLETGKTYFAPIEEDSMTTKAIVQVNGQEAGLDYEVKENDIVCIVITPAGDGQSGDWNWWGALTGSLTMSLSWGLTGAALGGGVFSWLGFAIGAVLGGIVGFIGGGIVGGQLHKALNMNKDGTSDSGLDSEKLPDVRGATNQPLLDQTYPFVMGKHLVSPFIIGSPWNEISGTHGQENYIHILYAVGYAPLRLTDFKLGDMFLAHNQRWADNKDMKNIFHGALTGIDEGCNDKGMDYYQANTIIDLRHRPLIKGSDMVAAGWTDVDPEGTATVCSVGYSNEAETTTILLTPIVDANTILTPSQLQSYADSILSGQGTADNILLATFTGEDSIAQSNTYAEGLHHSQATYYGLNGDIVNTWSNNDITLEILQQGQNGEAVDFGTVYPYAKIQRDVNANVLYIADGTLEEIDSGDKISYKGLGLKNGLRNNCIQFTEEYPKSAKVELDFSSGLYKSRSEKDGDNSKVKYYRIPLWVAIQWRVYSEENQESDGSEHGELPLPSYNSGTESYNTAQRGWHSFDTINGWINASTFNQTARNADIDAHSGNKLKTDGVYSDINTGWYGAKVFNLEPLGGTTTETTGINESRCITSVDFVEWTKQNLCTVEERENDEIVAKKFKAYFMDPSNTARSIEVRVVRISPCYIDETVSTKDNSAFKFNDIFTWTTLTSEIIDGDSLIHHNQIIQKRPLEAEIMKKLCVVSLKAKTDNVDQLTNTIKKFSCIAQSFAPYYDSDTRKWLPESVKTVTKYYKPATQNPEDQHEWIAGEEITEQQFYEDRQNGIKSTRNPSGNDFVPQMVNNVIRINAHKDYLDRYYIPYDDKSSGSYLPDCDGTLNYCTNNVASMFLLAGIGPHLGVDALGYEQSFYDSTTGERKSSVGDFDLTAFAKWYEELKCVTDGSTYPSNGYHYNEKGERVAHSKGEEVVMFFSANAYIYQTEMLENMFSKLAIAGRAVYTKDRKGRFTVIMDKPENYPVALINQQNTLKSSYTISYAELPSGLQIVFQDENDGYEQHNLYCMVNGEDYNNPHGAIEQYGLNYVTNNYQLFSLGNYLLANRVLNKEVVTKQLGIEGYSIGLGNLVLISDDTMLIGTDNGGRITQLIEDNGYIYGFIINSAYKYTGEEEELEGVVHCKQGVMVMQPSQYKESRIITLRLARLNSTVTVNGITYTVERGSTNTVIFETPIAKTQSEQNEGDYYVYRPEVDNIVSFGIVGKITSEYRVIDIKSDANHHFTFTLMKYQEDLYKAGQKLPSFQNNMTVPDRSDENAFAVSYDTTQKDLTQDINNVQSSMLAQIAELYSNHIVSLYKTSSSEISTAGITSNLTYDFSNDTVTWEDPSGANGWSTEVPAILTDVWVTSATAHGKQQTDTISPNEWARPIMIGQNGADGINTFTISLYKRLSTQPSTLPDTLVYRFDNASMACSNWNGWSSTIPAMNDDNEPCWEIHATALSTSTTDTIQTSEWSEPVKIFSEGYSKQEILDMIGDRQNETPNIIATPTTGIFAVDEDGIIPVPQSAYIDVRVVQFSEDIDFSFGTITTPTGITVRTVGNRLIFTAAQGVRLRDSVIQIPVNFIKYIDYDNLVDEDGNPLVWVADEDGKWYGDCAQVSDLPTAETNGFIYWNSVSDVTSTEEVVKGGVFHPGTFYTFNGTIWEESEILPLGIGTQSDVTETYIINYAVSTVMGGRYEGPINSVANIPSTPIIGDYFTWSGDNGTPYVGSNFNVLQTSCVYKWNGTAWEKDTSNRHLGTALPDILSLAEAQVAANNSDVTEMVKNMIAWNIVTQNIKVTGAAFINSTITANLTLGEDSVHNKGTIQSSNFTEEGTKGFRIKSDGTAVFRQLTVGSGSGQSLISSDGKINTNLINVGAIFTTSINVSEGGSLNGGAIGAGWSIDANGNATFNGTTTIGGTLTVGGSATVTGSISSSTANGWSINADGSASFTGTTTIGGNCTINGICNVDKLHFNRTYSPSDTGFSNGDLWVVSV